MVNTLISCSRTLAIICGVLSFAFLGIFHNQPDLEIAYSTGICTLCLICIYAIFSFSTKTYLAICKKESKQNPTLSSITPLLLFLVYILLIAAGIIACIYIGKQHSNFRDVLLYLESVSLFGFICHHLSKIN